MGIELDISERMILAIVRSRDRAHLKHISGQSHVTNAVPDWWVFTWHQITQLVPRCLPPGDTGRTNRSSRAEPEQLNTAYPAYLSLDDTYRNDTTSNTYTQSSVFQPSSCTTISLKMSGWGILQLPQCDISSHIILWVIGRGYVKQPRDVSPPVQRKEEENAKDRKTDKRKLKQA